MTDFTLEEIKELIFEIFSSGYEAGMLNKDIVETYNNYFNNLMAREVNG